jgi:hypothetical protein
VQTTSTAAAPLQFSRQAAGSVSVDLSNFGPFMLASIIFIGNQFLRRLCGMQPFRESIGQPAALAVC